MEHLNENEELYRAWIGTKNQDEYIKKMRTGGFNWVAFFLSDLLLITRKMFVESIALICIVFLVSTVMGIIGVPEIAYRIVGIMLSVGVGLSYYHLYRWNIKRKIEKYKRKGLSYEEQLEVARKQGGDKVTVAVLLVLLFDLVLAGVLTWGMIGTLNLIYDANNNTRYESNYNANCNDTISKKNDSNYNDNDYNYNYNYNYNNNNNDYLNNNYNQSTYSNNTNSANQKTWKLDSFNLTYNGNDWTETTMDNYKVLRYKNTDCCIAYVSSEKNEIGLAGVKNKSFQDSFEQRVKQQLESADKNLNYSYSYWEDWDDNVCLCKVECSYHDDDYSNYGYITYYYYFSNTKVYCLMTTEPKSDASFMTDSREVIETIKNNSQI